MPIGKLDLEHDAFLSCCLTSQILADETSSKHRILGLFYIANPSRSPKQPAQGTGNNGDLCRQSLRSSSA
jgi:hypothetical protein